jgi:hypothetical protein
MLSKVFPTLKLFSDEPCVPSDPGPGDVSDEPPFGLEVLNALLDLDTNKGLSPDGVPPLILKSCVSAFALPFCLLFNRSLPCVFPYRWKLSFVTLEKARIFFKNARLFRDIFRQFEAFLIVIWGFFRDFDSF